MRDLTGLVLYPLVCFLGLPANILGIIVMSMKQMRSSTTVFLIALTVTDLIKIIDDLLYFVTVLTCNISPVLGLKIYQHLYPYTHYIFHATMMAAAWIATAIAVERYIAVCHAYKAKFLCTITHSTIISGSIMMVSFLLSIPYALRYEVSCQPNNTESNGTIYTLTVSSLWKQSDFGNIFNWFHYAMRSLIPVILMTVFSICIMYGLRNSQLGHRKRRISVCLLAVIITFIVCVCPDTVMSTIFHTGYQEESYLTKGIREITDFLVLTHTIINFIIYCVFNPQFWKNLKGMMNCCPFPFVRFAHLSEGETMGLSQVPYRKTTIDLLTP